MSEAYWIGGSFLPLEPGKPESDAQASSARASAVLEAVLKQRAVRPGWLDEVYWLVEPGFDRIELADLDTDRTAMFTWQEQPLLGQHLLHAASRAIISRESDLLALGYSGKAGSSVCLLASPRAVGRYNLLPQVCLSARFALAPTMESGDWWQAVVHRLNEAGLELLPKDSAQEAGSLWLAASTGLALEVVPTAVHPLPVDNAGGLPSLLNAMAAALGEQPGSRGLVVQHTSRALLVSLFESV
jgi:hypothetical protein